MVRAQLNQARDQLSHIQLQHPQCLPFMALDQHQPQFMVQAVFMDQVQVMHQDLHPAQHMAQDQLV